LFPGPLRGPPLLTQHLPPRQIIRARRHRRIPAVPRPRALRRLQPLPQISKHGLQLRDPLRLLTDQRIPRIRRRLATGRISHSPQSSRNHGQPLRQHRARRQNVTSGHSSQHQAQRPECLPGNLPGIVAIRDSKDRSGPTLVVTATQWREFTEAIRAGEFNEV
jgi:hypothetical protein